MEIFYDSALVMPSSYAVMGEEEMIYLEGGATYDSYKTAKNGCSYLRANAAAFASLALGYGAAGVAGIATIVAGIIGAGGSALCGSMAVSYTNAYSDCSEIAKDYGANQSVRIREITMFAAFISKVTCVVSNTI